MVADQQRLLAADLWAIAAFEDPHKRLRHFHGLARPAYKRLIEGIILYDQVIIPTQDFLTLTSLILVLGEQSVIDLLEAGCVRFLRVKGSLMYAGGGLGITYGEMTADGKTPQPFCAPLGDAVDFALAGVPEIKDPGLKGMVLGATEEIDLKAMYGAIRHETYMDVLGSAHLRDAFAIRNKSMERLVGVAPNQVRMYTGLRPGDKLRGDEVSDVLAMAFANLELRMAQVARCLDASTASPIGHMLKGKVERIFGADKAKSAFAVLTEIAGIPDVGEGILGKRFSISDLIKLKRTRDGEQFRRWFHEKCSDDPRGTAREYCSLLRQFPKVQSLPARVLRFLATNAVGLLPGGMLLGAAAGTIDSFFVDQWLRGPSPKYFIEDVGQLCGR